MRRIILAVIFAALLVPAFAGQPELKFHDGKFRVLQLTDLHLMPNNPAKCAETEATVRAVVKRTNPDLIMLTGDVVTYDPAWTGWKRITDMMESLGVPYNVGMGNHDAEYLKKSDIYTYLLKSPNYGGALNGEGVITGGGTCAL